MIEREHFRFAEPGLDLVGHEQRAVAPAGGLRILQVVAGGSDHAPAPARR